jgi:hypothetical protein
MSAFTVAQILKYKGDHDISIFICDNNTGDGSIEYLNPFKDKINIISYPKDKLQSHGVGYDVLFELVPDEWVICLESDSYPIREGWLDYYEHLIKQGYDGAVSLLSLSGGVYGHPAGGLFRRSIWQQAWLYYKDIQYAYFPNIALKDTFSSHLMVRNDILTEFLQSPEDYIELSDAYKPYSILEAQRKLDYYSPTVGPMHSGLGRLQESVKTFGRRDPETEAPNIILDNRAKIIYRVGYEPGQAHYYWQLAKGYKIFHVPTEVHWLSGKENQQQEYTLNEAGIRHEWAISAYHDYTPESEKEVALLKQSIPDKLYNSLPEHQKIKL